MVERRHHLAHLQMQAATDMLRQGDAALQDAKGQMAAAAAITRCLAAASVAAAVAERDAALATVVEAEARALEAWVNNTTLSAMARDAVAGAEDFVTRSEVVLVRKEQDIEVLF